MIDFIQMLWYYATQRANTTEGFWAGVLLWLMTAVVAIVGVTLMDAMGGRGGGCGARDYACESYISR